MKQKYGTVPASSTIICWVRYIAC